MSIEPVEDSERRRADQQDQRQTEHQAVDPSPGRRRLLAFSEHRLAPLRSAGVRAPPRWDTLNWDRARVRRRV
jgi:hypothetical protein